MNNRSYTIDVETAFSAEEAFSRVKAVGDWWTKSFTGQAQQAGDKFGVRWGSTFVDFEVKETAPDTKMVWEVADSHLSNLKDAAEWTGTQVIWEATREGETTRIRITHQGLEPEVECYGMCEAGWNFFIGESLRGLLNGNGGMPDRVRQTA